MKFLVALAVFGFIIFLTTRLKRRDVSIGPGAAGTVYDMLNQDKRKAIEIILEERAGYRDPEDADGNLPDLDDPRAPKPPGA